MPSGKSCPVALEVLNHLIDQNQLSDVALELDYVADDIIKKNLLVRLLEKCCETENHALVVKICQTQDTSKLPRELRKNILYLAETCEVSDDFSTSVPTLIDIPAHLS